MRILTPMNMTTSKIGKNIFKHLQIARNSMKARLYIRCKSKLNNKCNPALLACGFEDPIRWGRARRAPYSGGSNIFFLAPGKTK